MFSGNFLARKFSMGFFLVKFWSRGILGVLSEALGIFLRFDQPPWDSNTKT